MPERTTYQIWLDENNEETLLVTFQDDIGLNNSQAQTAAVTRLQDIIDKINTPSPGTLSTRVGVVHPPGVSVRIEQKQERLE